LTLITIVFCCDKARTTSYNGEAGGWRLRKTGVVRAAILTREISLTVRRRQLLRQAWAAGLPPNYFGLGQKSFQTGKKVCIEIAIQDSSLFDGVKIKLDMSFHHVE